MTKFTKLFILSTVVLILLQSFNLIYFVSVPTALASAKQCDCAGTSYPPADPCTAACVGKLPLVTDVCVCDDGTVEDIKLPTDTCAVLCPVAPPPTPKPTSPAPSGTPKSTPSAVPKAGFNLEEAKINIQFGDLPTSFTAVDEAPCKCTPAEKAKDAKYCEDYEKKMCIRIPWVAQYLNAVYRYGVTLGSLLAVLMLMIGGVMYMMGGLNQTMISKAKSMMSGAVLGLILLLGTYVLLNTINPNLIKLEPIKIEVVREKGISSFTFCNEVPAAKYKVTDNTCGQEGSYEIKDKSIDEEPGKCIGSICKPSADGHKQWCLPSPEDKAMKENKVTCIDAAVWGYLKYDDGRFLDSIGLYALGGYSDADCVALDSDATSTCADPIKDNPGDGDKVYYIRWSDIKAAVASKKSSAKDSYMLMIELNDTGASNAAVTNSKIVVATQAGMSWIGFDGTIDDEYYVALNPENPISTEKDNEAYNGIWIEPCDTTVVWMSPKGEGWMSGGLPAEKGKKWKTMRAYDVETSGIRLDIDSKDFQEDADIDCSLADKMFGASLKVGAICGSNKECLSDDCELEQGSKRCECNEDEDCKNEVAPGDPQKDKLVCATSWNIWNSCIVGKAIGASCSDNSQCNSGSCSGGKCECSKKEDCAYQPYSTAPDFFKKKKIDGVLYGYACIKNIFSANECKYKREQGEACDKAEQCISNNCVGGSCMCDDDADCPEGSYCETVTGACMLQHLNLEICDEGNNKSCYKGMDCEEDHWYGEGTTETRCECNNNEDCGPDAVCIDIEDGCGWNYCLANDVGAPGVPYGYSSVGDSTVVASQKYWGLCDADSDCAGTALSPGDCITDWGKNNCNACKSTDGTALIGGKCPSSDKDACGYKLFCTDEWSTNICAPASAIACGINDSLCVGGGWKKGTCEGTLCDCGGDDDCSAGYLCANNTSGEYNGNDMCIPDSYKDIADNL